MLGGWEAPLKRTLPLPRARKALALREGLGPAQQQRSREELVWCAPAFAARIVLEGDGDDEEEENNVRKRCVAIGEVMVMKNTLQISQFKFSLSHTLAKQINISLACVQDSSVCVAKQKAVPTASHSYSVQSSAVTVKSLMGLRNYLQFWWKWSFSSLACCVGGGIKTRGDETGVLTDGQG